MYDLILRAAEELVKQIPDSMIDMRDFQDRKSQIFSKPKPCKTCACFAGHMPFLGVPGLEPIVLDYYSGDFSFRRYSERILGKSSLSQEWQFIFASCWPNSGEEILRRVKHLSIYQKASCVWTSKDGTTWKWEKHEFSTIGGSYRKLEV